MAGAGLTHGGFYSYFDSKSELYAEVFSRFFTDPNWKNRWEGVEVDMASADAAPQIVWAYLSRQHFENVENSCPMVALPSYVARSGRKAKRAFETVFKAMVGVLERGMSNGGRGRHATARRLRLCAWGGMVVARAAEDRRLADDLRDACMGVALRLGGWERNGKARTAKGKRRGWRAMRASRRKTTVTGVR